MFSSAKLSAAALALCLALSTSATSAAAPAGASMRFVDVERAPRRLAELSGQPAVLVFCRSDCGPCLVELRGLADIEAAASPAPVVTIALEDRAAASRALRKMGVQPRHSWFSETPSRDVLLAFNTPPPRLPLAVALAPDGTICARRIGLLGTDRVRTWAAQCGGKEKEATL